MGEMSALSRLEAENGPLEDMPNGFCKFHPEMKQLYLEGNRLRSIKLQSCSNLVHISLARNRLRAIPDLQLSRPSLTVMSMEQNEIKEIPTWMASMPVLAGLELFNNSISDISGPKWGSWTSLLSLSLSSNHGISKFPATIYSAPSLRVLELVDLPQIASLPDIPQGAGKTLRILDLRNTSITSLPPSFFNLPNLEQVYLDGTPLCWNNFADTVPAGSTFALAMSHPNGGCAKQCNLYCNYQLRTYDSCFATKCNNTACDYQNGACIFDK